MVTYILIGIAIFEAIIIHSLHRKYIQAQNDTRNAQVLADREHERATTLNELVTRHKEKCDALTHQTKVMQHRCEELQADYDMRQKDYEAVMEGKRVKDFKD